MFALKRVSVKVYILLKCGLFMCQLIHVKLDIDYTAVLGAYCLFTHGWTMQKQMPCEELALLLQY